MAPICFAGETGASPRLATQKDMNGRFHGEATSYILVLLAAGLALLGSALLLAG